MAHGDKKTTGLRTFIEGAQVGIGYMETIGLGQLDGHDRFGGLGRRDALATTVGGDDISDIVAVAIPWPNQTTGEQMTVVSDSANDTAAGTGARTVKIHYLDNTGTYRHTTVTLNGLTGVNTSPTNIRFIQGITVDTLGTFGGNAAGNITIHALGAPATAYARIVAGNNSSLSSARMVPAGKTFYMTSVTATATSSKPVSVRLKATCDHAGIYTEGVFQFEEIVECQDSGLPRRFLIPKKIPELAIIKGVAVSPSVGGGSVSISYDGWVE